MIQHIKLCCNIFYNIPSFGNRRRRCRKWPGDVLSRRTTALVGLNGCPHPILQVLTERDIRGEWRQYIYLQAFRLPNGFCCLHCAPDRPRVPWGPKYTLIRDCRHLFEYSVRGYWKDTWLGGVRITGRVWITWKGVNKRHPREVEWRRHSLGWHY